MPLNAIRGATTCENSKEAIHAAAKELLEEILERNNLSTGQVISVYFTATRDLDAAYPAPAARELGLTGAALMCAQEMHVEDSLSGCIRVMVLADGAAADGGATHVYLRGAVCLRPDLVPYAVAIDGPAGAGKSTVARLVADALGFIYVDTGALYRALAFHLIKAKADLSDEAAISALLLGADVELRHIAGEQRVLLNGEDVSDEIRQPAVSEAASVISQYEAVRAALLDKQRNIAKTHSVVMDGRDIASVVLPEAQTKIYLDATPRERAKRRTQELTQKGVTADIDEIEREIIKRDERDMNRPIAPLTRHKDAVYIDTSGMTAPEAAARIVEIYNANA